MDINDLKKTWNKMSAGRELNENQLRDMLGRRTKSLIERIDRNVKIGFAVLLGLIVLFSLDDLWLSPQTINNYYNETPIPNWVIYLAVFGNVLILTTFLYFVYKYYKVKRSCDVVCDLKETLKKIIGTLELYQRLFYLALAIVIISMGSAFIAGMFIGTEHNAALQGIQMSEIETGKILFIIFITVVILALLGGSVFLFLRWGFRRLYGNYIKKLKTTLTELEEIKDW